MIDLKSKLIPIIATTAIVGGLAYGGATDKGGVLYDGISTSKVIEKYSQADIQIKSRYQLEGSALKVPAPDKNSIAVTLGDSTKPEFEPKIEIKRWDNTTKFSIKPQGIDIIARKDKDLVFEGDKIKFETPDIDYHFYETTTDEGGYEYELVLKSKPATGTFYSTIESEGLEFYKQLPLTQEQIDEGSSRPENVINSYAVYYSGSPGDYSNLGGYNFRAGKAFHIYRIKAIDADGVEMWCDQNIVGNQHQIVCPFDWLDKIAKYPVTIDPTFGYTTKGGSTATIDNKEYANKYTGSVGTLTKISAYLNSTDANSLWKFALYRDSDDVLIAQTSQEGSGTIDGLSELNCSNESISSVDYLISAMGGNSTNNPKIYYDTGATFWYDAYSYTGTFQNPATWTLQNSGNVKLSIYATYAEITIGVTYDFSSTSTAKRAWYGQEDLYTATHTPPRADRTQWTFVTGTPFTAAMYSYITSTNNVFATTAQATSGTYYYLTQIIHDFEMDVTESPRNIGGITWTWTGYLSRVSTTNATATNSSDLRMYARDYYNNDWVLVDARYNSACSSTACTMTYSTTSALYRFLQPTSSVFTTRWLVTGVDVDTDCYNISGTTTKMVCATPWVATDTFGGTTTMIGCMPQASTTDENNQCPPSIPNNYALGCATGLCAGETGYPFQCGRYTDGQQHDCPICAGCTNFSPIGANCTWQTTGMGAGLWGCDGECQACAGESGCVDYPTGTACTGTPGYYCVNGFCDNVAECCQRNGFSGGACVADAFSCSMMSGVTGVDSCDEACNFPAPVSCCIP